MKAYSIFAAVVFVGAAAVGEAQTHYELAVVDLQGRRVVQGDLPLETFAPRISPDGRRVVFDIAGEPADAGPSSIWIADLADPDGRETFASDDAMNAFPVWTPNGDAILYISDGTGEQMLYSRPVDSTEAPRRLTAARAPEAFKDGGEVLSFITLKDGHYSIWTLSLADSSEAPLIDRETGSQHSTHFSPDGRWVAYAADDTGRFEVWVEPVPTTGERHQLTTEGGGYPLWSPLGDEIFFYRDGALFAVPVETGDGFSAGQARPLPIEGFVQGANRRQFDLMPGGDSFLMLFPSGAD